MAAARALGVPGDRQAVGLSLTAERVITDTGTWWVWRNAATGHQVHAGLGGRQLVDGRYYVLGPDMRWGEEIAR